MRLWFAAAVLIGLAILGLATVPRAVDWDAYRPDIEATAIELSGHDVTIGGPIAITLLPRPVLTARDVTLTGRTDEAIGFELSANQADVTLEIGPLLAGRMEVRDLSLKRPVLSIDSDGSRRLRSWPPRSRDWAAPFLKLDLKAIKIADGRIELASERPGEKLSFNDLSMQLRIGEPGGPLEAAGLFKTERHDFTVTAELGRPDGDGVSAAKFLIEARNGIEETTKLRFSGRVDPSGDDEGLSGRITLQGPDLQHGLAAISAATGYPSTFRSFATAQPFAVEGRIKADRAGIRSEDLQLTLSEKLGKGRIDLRLHPQKRLDLDVDLPTLRLADAVGLDDFLPLDLLSKLSVPPGEIDLRLRELVYQGEAARKASVSLKTGADQVTLVKHAKVQLPGLVDLQFEGGLYAGEIGPRLKGKLAAVGDDLGSSLAWIGLIEADDRSGGWRGFSLESDVDVSSVEMALPAIDMRLDSSKLAGKASLRFSERQRLVLDVDVERPNLDLYVTDVELQETAERLAALLRGLDVEIDARFKRLTWQGVHVEEGEISADVEQGKLTLRKMAAKTVGDTMLSLNGNIDLEANTADISGELNSEHPARALHHLEVTLPLSSSRPRALKLTGNMSGTFDRFTLNADIDYDEGGAAVKGEAGWIQEQPWYDLSVNARHPDHQALASQFGLAPLVAAGDAKGALELAGRLRHGEDAPWIASGSTKLGPTTFTGSLTFQGAPLDSPFEAKLSVGSPRKDSLAPFLILTGLRLTGDWTPARWLGRLPTTGLRTAWLEKVEGTLSLVSKGGLVGDGLQMDAKLGGGLLYIERLEASPWQGRLQAEVTLERRRDQPFLAIAVDLDQVEAADFATWLGVKNGISGPLDMHIEASSVGRTPFDMMAGLAGEVVIKAGPGEIKGLGVPDFRQALLSNADDEAPVDRSLTLPFGKIDAKADLSRGILSFEGSRLGFPSATGSETSAIIAGTADLLLWIADLNFDAVAEGVEKGAASKSGPAYRLFGPPDRPIGLISAEN